MKKQKNAKDSALNLLARREHSRMELTQKLKLRNFSENEISQTIEQLTQQDLQSDKRFAECYMRSRAEKGFGPVRIKFELREKGVDDSLIEIALNQKAEEWLNYLAKAYRKKFGQLNVNSLNLQEKNKQTQFLIYKGFSFEQIKEFFK